MNTHFFFFLVSIPYLYIIYRLHIRLTPEVAYLVQYIPLVRGGYALAVVVGWFTSRPAAGAAPAGRRPTGQWPLPPGDYLSFCSRL